MKRGLRTMVGLVGMLFVFIWPVPSNGMVYAQLWPLTVTEDDRAAVTLARSYVVQTRDWPVRSFRIELRRRDGDVLAFWVLHNDDEAKMRPNDLGGSEKSFWLEVDAKSFRVVREAPMQ
ncbi:MAG TPA: hypothetical protein VFO36_03585 [Nitrospiraceae bacterium]|nr:hypothetical protein [Nitrospiraceae bacterium]